MRPNYQNSNLKFFHPSLQTIKLPKKEISAQIPLEFSSLKNHCPIDKLYKKKLPSNPTSNKNKTPYKCHQTKSEISKRER